MGLLSSIGRLDFCIPQGSVLGPFLFLLYTAELFSAVRSHQHKKAGSTLIRWWYTAASQCIGLPIIGRSSAVLGVHRGDRWLDAGKQTQIEHWQNPTDLDRNAPAAVKGRHQWDRTAVGHGIVLHICVELWHDSRQSAQDDRSCRRSLSILLLSTTPDTFNQAVADIRWQENASECICHE